ncbi:MAG: ACT domain-containing protein, partial [Paracoccaceae bacterium]
MGGEMDLAVLLQGMTPALDAAEFGYGLIGSGQEVPGAVRWFAVIEEDEGRTVIGTVAELTACGIDHVPGWARISLAV